jgi:DNA invertase Pin-like site-specific DNA recombinase
VARNKQTAVAYLRVSGKGQVDGDGFPRQRAAVQAFAKRAGLHLAGEYTDAGVSGTRELADRAGLAALLDRLESNGVRIVLVERADRLARDLMVSEVILGQFRKLGVRVIAAESGTDLTAADGDPTATLIRQILGAVAEFDKSVTVLKLRAARERARRTHGRCEGRKPYGDRPGEPEIVAHVLALRRTRPTGKAMTYAAVAAELNKAGAMTRCGKRWHPGTVYAIVQAHRSR